MFPTKSGPILSASCGAVLHIRHDLCSRVPQVVNPFGVMWAKIVVRLSKLVDRGVSTDWSGRCDWRTWRTTNVVVVVSGIVVMSLRWRLCLHLILSKMCPATSQRRRGGQNARGALWTLMAFGCYTLIRLNWWFYTGQRSLHAWLWWRWQEMERTCDGICKWVSAVRTVVCHSCSRVESGVVEWTEYVMQIPCDEIFAVTLLIESIDSEEN